MIYLIGTITFILLQAFFSGIETGLVSLQKPRVKNGVRLGHNGADILDFFLKNPGIMLATTLLGTNISVVLASISATKTFELFGVGGKLGIAISALSLTLLLLAAEIIPKNWFRQDPYGRCRRYSYLLYISYIVLFPAVKLLSALTEKIVRFFGKPAGTSKAMFLREDFRILLRDSEKAGIIDSEAADILDNSIDFYALTVKDIMTTRKDTIDLPAGMTIKEAVDFGARHSVSRMPVYMDEEEKHWIGTFSIYDAIFGIPECEWGSLKVLSYLRPAHQLAPEESIEEILTVARKNHYPLLVVSSTEEEQQGVVTPADAVRNIFGGKGQVNTIL